MAADALIRPVHEADLEQLAATMRAEDAAECAALAGLRPLEALRRSLGVSTTAFAAECEGELMAIGGVAPGPLQTLLGPAAFDVIWLLTSEAVDRHQRAFWKASRLMVAELRTRHPVLTNLVDARYMAALRWVRRLGAEVRSPVLAGVEGRLFHPIFWRS